MKITPLDIRRREFKRSMRGYSDEEVDIFLDEVADEFERLFQENMELEDRVQRLDEQIAAQAELRDALEKTLVSAQIQSDEIRANARKESELILQDARLKAQGIVNDSYAEIQRVQQTLVQLKRLEEEFRFKFRSLLEGYLQLLSEGAFGTTTSGGVTLENEWEPAAGTGPSVAGASEEPAVEMRPSPEIEAKSQSEPEAAAIYAAVSADDTPTEESEAPGIKAEEPTIGPDSDDEATNELPVAAIQGETEGTEEGDQEEDTPRAFFFGRQLSDLDDTFPGKEALDKNRSRDFEW